MVQGRQSTRTTYNNPEPFTSLLLTLWEEFVIYNYETMYMSAPQTQKWWNPLKAL